MKLFKSILLIAACHAAQASAAIDINADPNLTGAAPLTGILNGQQSDTQNMSGFDNTPPPACLVLNFSTAPARIAVRR